jgi:hypothetical protein
MHGMHAGLKIPVVAQRLPSGTDPTSFNRSLQAQTEEFRRPVQGTAFAGLVGWGQCNERPKNNKPAGDK